ncbi:MAG: hypothetical protein JKY99_02315 [Rhizobiales bacterium]|nr:hypothetical protein [Hyphomicrobiales bacterium]PHQ72419.1 MAG: hypothetical protein COB93_00310 [Sneathiella sp.]
MFAGALGYFNQDRSHDIDMVKIALSILQGENKDTSLQGRKFALRTLAKYSEIAIPADEFDSWAANGTIPEFSFPHTAFTSFQASRLPLNATIGIPMSPAIKCFARETAGKKETPECQDFRLMLFERNNPSQTDNTAGASNEEP